MGSGQGAEESFRKRTNWSNREIGKNGYNPLTNRTIDESTEWNVSSVD
jgi:hypothetical protein